MTTNCKSLVSVIIPTYNRAHVLGRSIKSVLEQTFTDFELIVVDDGSTDNTQDVVSCFNDPRIRFLRLEQNGGVSAARNTGIKASRGEYIAFNDSDDEWLPQKLERQMKLFDHDKTGSLGLVTCGAIFGNVTRERSFSPQQHFLNYEELLYHRGGHGVGTQRLIVKRSLVGAELYFDEYLPVMEDWDFALRLSRIVRIGIVSEALVKVHRTEGPHIQGGQNEIHARLAILKKYAAELKARPKMLGRHHEQLALSYYSLRDMRHARAHFQAAMKAYPRRPVTYFYFISSLFGRSGLSGYLKMHNIAGMLLRQIKS